MAKKPRIEGGYIVIPKNTIKCNQYRFLGTHAKAVYSAILTEFIRDTRLNPENKVKITHNQMEEISGVSHSSVVRGIRELKEKGFIRVLISGGLEGNPTTFQLNKRYTDSGDIISYW